MDVETKQLIQQNQVNTYVIACLPNARQLDSKIADPWPKHTKMEPFLDGMA
jgi:hypothetical protein